MISKAHKDKLMALWEKGLRDRNREYLIQAYELLKAISEGGRDIEFERTLLEARDDYAGEYMEELIEQFADELSLYTMFDQVLHNHIGDPKIYEKTLKGMEYAIRYEIGERKKQILSILDYAYDVIQQGSNGGFVF